MMYLFCAALVGMCVAVRDQEREIEQGQGLCITGDCSKCTSCSECDGMTCKWVTNVLKIDPSKGRYAGSFNNNKWGMLNANENKMIAEENLKAQAKLEKSQVETGLRYGVKVGGYCESKDKTQSSTFQETRYVSSGCKKLQAQIEADLNSFHNQHTTVKERIRAKDQDNAMREVRKQAFLKSFNEAAACDERVSITIQQAVNECRQNPNKDAEFFQKVYCVKVEDLRRNALLDSPFDDKHGTRTDQEYVDELKDVDPFTWNNHGHPDPIHMFISSEKNFMVAVIESGRHRATAMVQPGGNNYPSVPVRFDCRCPCDNTHAQLYESEEVRGKIEVSRPDNMIPLSCYGNKASKHRDKSRGC